MIQVAAVVLGAGMLVALLIRTVEPGALLYWAAGVQRDVQNAMAASLRAIHAGNPMALFTLCGLTFGYGFVHAIGPGHGKLLLGAAAISNRATFRRMCGLTLASSLGQSLTAILLVLGGIQFFSLTSASLIRTTEQFLAPASFAAIGLIGCILALRGIRAIWQVGPESRFRAGGCAEHGTYHCSCGHRHAPLMHEVSELRTYREMAALVTGIAIRPCTGALFLLVIAWRLQILPAGIIATLAMGLGTATFNLLITWSSTGARLLLTIVGTHGSRSALLLPAAQLTAGLMVATVALTTLWTYF